MRVARFHSLFLVLAPFLLLAFAPKAKSAPNADPIQGVSLATFANPQPTCPPATCTGVGTNSFTWGIPSSGPTAHVSSLDFSGRNVSIEEGETFVTGEIEYYNGTTELGTGVEAVNLCIQVDIAEPAPQTLTGCRSIYIVNSPNTSDPIESADSVTMRTGIDFFVIEGGSASATVLARVSEASIRSSTELELEIVGFGEVTSGDGFLRSYIYLPLIEDGS